MKTIRLDKFLAKNNYFSSRAKAQFNIESETIKVNGEVVNKNSYQVNENDIIEIIEQACPYVSKGGLKLEKAIDVFLINFNGASVLDIGASTGGFTDCALQFGADHVTSIDVGTDQLDKSLLVNKKVKSIEQFNLRDIDKNTFANKFDFVVTDVSFISLTHVFDILDFVINPKGKFIALIKPQFELENNRHKGIVRKKNMHKYAIRKVIEYAINRGYYLNGLTYSPIKGSSGNIEFLSIFSKQNGFDDYITKIETVVQKAHKEL